MSLPDQRIRYPSAKIDFEAEVGITGQDHDNYPPPGGQARFDHLRMVLIGLLSQQASYDMPTEYRDGTPWFDLNTMSLKVRMGNEWTSYSDAIKFNNDITLTDWYNNINLLVSAFSPEIFFGGKVNSTTSNIPIPANLQSQITSESRVFLVVNGSNIDPRESSFIGTPYPSIISLSSIELEQGDNYFVSIRKIQSSLFITSNQNVS